MKPGLLSCLLVLLLSLGWAPRGHCQTEQVGVFGVESRSPLSRQLSVELASLGFRLVLLGTPKSTDLDNDVSGAIRERELVAVIHIGREAVPEVSVWLLRGESLIAVRQTLSDRGQGLSPRVVALRAAELLRTSLHELEWGQQERPEAPAVSPPPDAPAPVTPRGRRPPRLGLGVSGVMTVSPGGFDPIYSVGPNLELWVTPSWGVSALAVLPLARSELAAAEGRADVSVALFGGGPSARFGLSNRWQTLTGVALGVAVIQVDGEATQPFTSESTTITPLFGMATLSTGYYLTPNLRLSAGLLFGALVSAAEIVFVDRTVARWGSVFGSTTLSVTLSL